MRSRIHTSRHPAKNSQPPIRQIARQQLRHPRPIRRRLPRPNHRNPRARSSSHPSKPKHRRRIIDLPQPLRILFILKRSHRPTRLGNALHLLFSRSQRTPIRHKLRRPPRHPHGLQLRQRSLKHPLPVPSRSIALLMRRAPIPGVSANAIHPNLTCSTFFFSANCSASPIALHLAP